MYREALSSQNVQVLADLLGENELLVIDEAQTRKKYWDQSETAGR